MTIYTAGVTGVAATAAQDIFELVAAAGMRYAALREIKIAQYTDFGDAEAELISVQLIRGYTTSGSGGSTPTKYPFRPGAVAAGCTLEANNTTVASAGTAQILHADTFNVASGWWYRPPEDERIIIDGDTAAQARLVCRISAPADSITINATIVWEENPHIYG